MMLLLIYFNYNKLSHAMFFFFFQAEDGIRDRTVTGVQTCALPISPGRPRLSLGCRTVSRSFFGTDGVRGIVGEAITPELVERLGRAATLWSGSGDVFVGRDTRASGPELEEAFARGAVSAGGTVRLGGVLPTPAIALAA